jgi:hypothetical protein
MTGYLFLLFFKMMKFFERFLCFKWSSFGEQEPYESGAEEDGTDDDEGVPDSVRQMPKQKRVSSYQFKFLSGILVLTTTS